ncbi:Major facilitator superfamily [Pleurostoma richardsiae]|uniref:Major facilitator superfamily n=1 Tax=Pleurostoma richardsiae TaxID=41990 RepID=A0AA38RNN0_9PEZI|nr:Major facilitator superfamily [Pleurostoma richardsiae]
MSTEKHKGIETPSMSGREGELEPASGCDGETIAERDGDVETAAGATPEASGSSPSAIYDGLDWDGPDDPDNPMNWPHPKRVAQIIIIALNLLLANLAATMFAPGAAQVMAQFSVSSATVGSLTVSIYILGFAVGPLVWGPLSELYGRLPVYAVSGLMFAAFIVGTAFANSLGAFLVLRLLSGSSGAAALACSGGTLADVIPPQQRGKWMALFVLGPILGPTIGPIMGGFISEDVGWRWVFRVLAIACGALFIPSVFYLRETYGPVILRRRELQRRKAKGDGAAAPALKQKDATAKLWRGVERPFKLLLLSPLVTFMSLYGAFYFGLLFLLFTTFSTVFRGQYGFSTGTAGLAYIGMGVGMLSGVISQARFSDRIMKQRAAKNGRSKPEDRLPLMAYMAPVTPIGMFWYGWSANEHTHWIVPILGTFFVGVGFTFALMPTMVYLVDCFGAEAAASALAANTVLRSFAGAFLPLAGPPMYDALGLGWGNSLLGFLALALIPIPWIFTLYGEKIRLSRKVTL